jgi:dienelactone hydrolase
MKKMSAIMGLICILILASCAAPAVPPPVETPAATLDALPDTAKQLAEYLAVGDGDSALALMDTTMKEALAEQAAGLWQQLTGAYGAFEGYGASDQQEIDGYQVVFWELHFANTDLLMRAVFDTEGLISGLFFTEGTLEETQTEPALADNDFYTEIAVEFAADPQYPLSGTLTLPKNAAPRAALVLIHGSGPNTRDEKVGANQPFAELAYELATRGYAVLRYDKRTFTHGATIAQNTEVLAKLTIAEETVADAVAAVSFLQENEQLGGVDVFLLGHSLGGGLLSHIGAQVDCSGYISLAGSPQPLWELSAAQNLLYVAELEAAGQTAEAAEAQAVIATEREKAAALLTMTDEEALSTTVFGISGWYLRDLGAIDAAALHLSDRKPMLILQGGADRQVTTADFELWKTALAAHPDATFRLYPTLNHIFGEYTGEPVPFTQLTLEYATPTPIPAEVFDDIAAWLEAHIDE